MTMLEADPQVLAFIRASAEQRVLCVFNFSESAATWEIPAAQAVSGELNELNELTGSGLVGGRLDGTQIDLMPWGGLFVTLA